MWQVLIYLLFRNVFIIIGHTVINIMMNKKKIIIIATVVNKTD